MKLSDKTIEQVKENRDLIESKNWLEIWETLENSELNWAFVELGYNPLSGLEEIPSAYFAGSLVKSIVIPDSVTRIGYSAFDNCTSLTSVVIPNSVTSINDFAFYRCKSLKSIEIPDSVINIGYKVFRGCTSLTSVVIPNSVEIIEDLAFSGCNLLSNIVYKGSIKEFEAIKKLKGWNDGVPATKVICNDGVVGLI
jgi:hypothetical protein